MTKHRFYVSLAIALLQLSLFAQEKNLIGSRPNIILVLTDDQGYGDLGATGHPFAITPNIDTLFYDQSTRFTDYHVSPTCAPSRAGIMSGRAPFAVGTTHTIYDREQLVLGVPTVADVLQEAGYRTAVIGKWHLGDGDEYQPGIRGFDEVFIHGAGGIGQRQWGDVSNSYFDPIIRHNGTFVQTTGFCTDVFFNHTLNWIGAGDEQEKPFFAFLSLNAPHAPFIAPDEYANRYNQGNRGFFGMITNIDDNMKIMNDYLEKWGLTENTLVIYMTDNGTNFNNIYNAGMRGKKNTQYEGCCRATFFARWPGTLDAGLDIDNHTRHMDVLPTFAALAGASVEGMDIDGRSLVPLLINPDAPWEDRYTFFHKARWGEGEEPNDHKYAGFAVRDEQWRLSGASENNWELYDIVQDPGEQNNVAGSNPDVVQEMLAAYDTWWDEMRPLMVHDDRPHDASKPFQIAYAAQQQTHGIPDWPVPNLDAIEVVNTSTSVSQRPPRIQKRYQLILGGADNAHGALYDLKGNRVQNIAGSLNLLIQERGEN